MIFEHRPVHRPLLILQSLWMSEDQPAPKKRCLPVAMIHSNPAPKSRYLSIPKRRNLQTLLDFQMEYFPNAMSGPIYQCDGLYPYPAYSYLITATFSCHWWFYFWVYFLCLFSAKLATLTDMKEKSSTNGTDCTNVRNAIQSFQASVEWKFSTIFITLFLLDVYTTTT